MSKKLTASDIQEMIDQSRFHQLFRPQVLTVDHDNLQLVVKALMGEELERQPGTNQWHGGAISAIIDTVGCYGLASVTGGLLPTINFRTDYLRFAEATDLTVTATVRRAGKTVGVVDVDVADDSGRLIAVGRASYSMSWPEPREIAENSC